MEGLADLQVADYLPPSALHLEGLHFIGGVGADAAEGPVGVIELGEADVVGTDDRTRGQLGIGATGPEAWATCRLDIDGRFQNLEASRAGRSRRTGQSDSEGGRRGRGQSADD